LKHDAPTRIIKQQQHLKHVPDYIVPKTLSRARATMSTSVGSVTFQSRHKRKRMSKKGAQAKVL